MLVQPKLIFRHPIKGLMPEALTGIWLEAGKTLPHDRVYAVAHASSEVDRDKPDWVPRRNFLVVAQSPRLALVRGRFDADAERLIIDMPDDSRTFALAQDVDRLALARWLEAYAGPTQPPPFQFLRVSNGAMTDSPTATVSILNLASLRALAAVVGAELDPRRFRGNLWVDIEPAWCEAAWIGKDLELGDARVRVTEPIERCTATNANPETGACDQNLPLALRRLLGEANFGVLAEVTRAGEVTVKPD